MRHREDCCVQLRAGIKKAGPRGGTHRFLGFRRRRQGPTHRFLGVSRDPKPAPTLTVSSGCRGTTQNRHRPRRSIDDVAELLCSWLVRRSALPARHQLHVARLPDRARTRVALVAHFIRKSKCVVRCLEAIFSSDRCAIAVCRSCRFLGWAHWVVGGTHRFLTPKAKTVGTVS